MNIRKGAFLFIRITLGIIYLWVVSDRSGLLGPAGNTGVVWGNFDTFLDYTATLNPWFPRAVSDVLGYLATITEVVLAIMLLGGIRLKEAALASAGLLLTFLISIVFSVGFKEAFDFIVFTIVVAAASALLYREAKRNKEVEGSRPV